MPIVLTLTSAARYIQKIVQPMSSAIEDEVHFLLHCPKYVDLRKGFIEQIIRCHDGLNRLYMTNRSVDLFVAETAIPLLN